MSKGQWYMRGCNHVHCTQVIIYNRSSLYYIFRKERRRTRLLNSIKRSAGAIKSSLPKIKDVNVIDKYSRFIFPVSFIIFNVAYWCFYVMETWMCAVRKQTCFYSLNAALYILQTFARKCGKSVSCIFTHTHNCHCYCICRLEKWSAKQTYEQKENVWLYFR